MSLSTSPPDFLRHVKRPEWGMAMLVERDGDRWRYRFQDGETRTFGPTALSMLELAQPTDNERDALAKPKRATAKRKAAPKKTAAKAAAPATDEAAPAEAEAPAAEKQKTNQLRSDTFERQLGAFKQIFPGGFADERFIEQQRGVPGGRKAWQAASIELCHTLMDVEVLRAALLDGGKGVFARVKKIVTRAKAVLDDSEAAVLAALEEGSHEELRFTETLFSMLHSEGDPAHLFEKLASSLPQQARTWAFTTLIPGLYDPAKHVIVHPKWTARQAEILGYRLGPLVRPSGDGYAFALKLSDEVKALLEKADLTPRDRIDVLSFSQRTG